MSREATVRPKLAFDGHVARFGAPASLDASLSPLASRVLCAAVDRLDDVIEDALESAASALGVDRAGIVWQSDLARLPWYSRQLRRGDPVVLGRLPDDLPGEALPEAQAAAALGLKSHLLLPLRSGDEVLGGLELASFRSCRHWSAKEVASLELLAGALASALCRRRTEERLRAAELHVAELERARDELQRGTREARPLKEAWDAEPAYAKRVPYRTQGFERLIGTSGTLAKVLYQVERVASTESPVLILGETGTGKELVARAIHENSRRKARPLVPVNCAALPDTLIESELFGYEKGAFTGAATRTFGRFEHAHGGSILLDEIGELPLGAQAKLLRVLESGSFERLGSAKPVRVDVRVLAATNRDLEKDVREGRFRADLYYRLNVFPLTVPPLRERREDVPLLVWHFVNAKQAALGRTIERIPARLMRALQAHDWPGNVRELENVIERALIVGSGCTLESEIGLLETTPGEFQAPRRDTLADVQRAHIEAVLRQCDWKVGGRGNAADRLGLKRGTLQFRMKRLGIRRPEKAVVR